MCCAAVALLAIAGCASPKGSLPPPAEVSGAGVAARVLAPPNLNVNPSETVVRPAGQGPPTDLVYPLPPVGDELELKPEIFGLGEAIAFGLANNPRLRSASAPLQALGVKNRSHSRRSYRKSTCWGRLVLSPRLWLPAFQAPRGLFWLADSALAATRKLNWDCNGRCTTSGAPAGNTGKRSRRERMTELRLDRARQTVEFDVATAYLDVLLARASRRVQEDAVRRGAGNPLLRHDGAADRGDVLKENVLRCKCNGRKVNSRWFWRARESLCGGAFEQRDGTQHGVAP